MLQQLCTITAAGCYADDLAAVLIKMLQDALHQLRAVVGEQPY